MAALICIDQPNTFSCDRLRKPPARRWTRARGRVFEPVCRLEWPLAKRPSALQAADRPCSSWKRKPGRRAVEMLAITRHLVRRLESQLVYPLRTKTASMSHAWGYASSELPPERWFEDYPIAKGKRQSPIDIVSREAKPQCFVPFEIGYDVSGVKSVNNNGHSVTFMASGAGSVAGGPLKSKYTLEQFHFHWGSDSSHGSEHLLDGKSFAAELHLVHWNSEKYSSFAESLEHPDGLCVLGAFLQPGHCENFYYKPLVDEIKSVPFKGDQKDVTNGFDPRLLLPEDVACYFHYGGSLTTPPLKECVQWVVFKNPVDVSESQLQAFRNLHFGGKGSPCMCNNFRPPQELCSRDVFSS